MMSLSFLPLVLLFLRVAVVEPGPFTFEETDPVTGERLQCDRCPPGTYLRARCTAARKSDCAPCPTGSFTELWNYIGKCLRCGVCGHDQVVKAACTADSDCQCECRQGFYFQKQFDMCLPHSECPPGQGVLTAGNADHDTVCQVCPNGTYSDVTSAHLNCTEHARCHGAGLHLVLRGSTWHDSVCASCEESTITDGAVYLKEIIPPLFSHHKMPLRRLRRIVHRLPSEGGKREGGRTSGLNLSELHERISTWVASATGEQVRQLPDILSKAGAGGAADRLKLKLQRIDSRLGDVCAFGNEVEADLLLG